jgi:hypothetical protein
MHAETLDKYFNVAVLLFLLAYGGFLITRSKVKPNLEYLNLQLLESAHKGDSELITKLVEKGASVNCKSDVCNLSPSFFLTLHHSS